MKIIAFGDIHMATAALADIDKLSSCDLIIVTGDITNFGHRKEAKIVLNEILAYNQNMLCLAGNMDNLDINDYLDNLGMNLHGQAHVIKREVCLFGVGSSNRTPFGTPWELTEKKLARLVDEAYKQAQELIELATPIIGYKIPTILVSHAPPAGTNVDKIDNGKHVGSTAVRRFIENHSPDLCLTGHIHEGAGEDYIGTTKILNPGMLKNGGWVSINIEKTHLDSQLQWHNR